MREFSFHLFTKRGANHFDPKSRVYQHYRDKLRREPQLSDLSQWHLTEMTDYAKYAEFITALQSGEDLYVMFNSGARKGSIAKIISGPKIVTSQYSDGWRLEGNSEVVVEWANGKTHSFNAGRNAFYSKDGEYHSILADYDGDPVYNFEKKARVAQPIPVLKDNYGRVVEVGHWVMDKDFKIGKVSRISPAGTLWIDMLEQTAGRYGKVKAHTQQFGRHTSELLRVDLPEGFEVTATIMDKDITGLDIIPTFTYQARYD